MKGEKNKVLFDWVSFTSKIHSPVDIIEMLGLDAVKFQTLPATKGYQERFYYDSVSIHFNGRKDMGVWCEMSGQGCRAFESYGTGDYSQLFATILNHGEDMNLTRLDIAFDDHEGLLDINKLCDDTRCGNFVSKFSSWLCTEGSDGNSLLHGSKKSEILIRIYDKAKERHMDDDVHWIRLEVQLRRDRARLFVSNYASEISLPIDPGSPLTKRIVAVNVDIAEGLVRILNSYLRYVQPSKDSNKRRWATADYWQKLLITTERIKLYEKPGVDYNMDNLERFVFQQAGNAIDTFLDIKGLEEFQKKLKSRGTTPNVKYQALKQKILNN